MLAAQIWRLPRIPHADCAWQVPPLAWQQTSPPEQSLDAAQIVVVPDGQAALVWQVATPAPESAPARQHALPVAQSVGAEQTWAVPEAHAVWHVLGPPEEPRQHCWPIMQSPVPMHDGGVRQVP